MLAEAGYAKGFKLQLWRSKRAELVRIAQAVQQDLGLLGIHALVTEQIAERRLQRRHAPGPLGERPHIR